MRLLWFAALFTFVISCSQKNNETTSASDSLTSVSPPIENSTAQVESTASPEPTGPPPTYGDMYFEPDLFITTDIDSLVMLLKSRLAISKDKILFNTYEGEYDSVKVIMFEGSELMFDRTRDGDYVPGDFEIKTTGFPFKGGLIIGMPRRDAIAIMGIDSTAVERYGKEDRYLHDFLTGSGDHILFYFHFDQTNFIGLRRSYEDMD